jgi:3-oxoacyl-[acyl-carrier protein] reductase
MSEVLAEKVALVTGGSRGIGAAIVKRLAHDGAAVAFTYTASADKARSIVSGVESRGPKALAIRADSADANAVKGAVAQTVNEFGRLDILVNNAGILIRGTVDQYDLGDFERMFAVNVRGVFVGIQAALPHLGRGSRIITTGSVVADRSGFPGASVYSMTKGAIASMTRGLARDLGPRGITVNTVQPGPTDTDITDDESIRAMVRPLMALGRTGRDAEIASLVAYLAGPESSFITGAALTIDGGYLA